MKFYAALLAVLMVGIAVGQKKQEPENYLCTGFCMTQTNKAKVEVQLVPTDVPAIQETRTFDMVRGIDLASCGNLGGKLEKNSQMCQRQESYWTCAEKSRILEHDESTPAKYWCRKPQP